MANLIAAIERTPEILVLLLFLLVPGFLIIRVFDALHPGRRHTSGHQIIDVGIWSVANLAVWFLPAIILIQHAPRLSYWLYHLLLFVLIMVGVFATPLLLAYILHRLERRGTLKNLVAEETSTPSDWVFSGSAEDHYHVRFHRKEGKDLGGYFGKNSFASSTANGQEIYVEEVWRLDEDGRFIERVEGTRGAIVNTEDCELIEFFEPSEARDSRTLDGGRSEPSKNETSTTHKPLES